MTAIRERIGDGEAKWDTSLQEVDESREKLESVKVALVSAAVGSVALLPLLFFRYQQERRSYSLQWLSPICLSVYLSVVY